MELMMFIGGDCIDFVPIEQGFITLPGYVGHFVKLLRKKYERLSSAEQGTRIFIA